MEPDFPLDLAEGKRRIYRQQRTAGFGEWVGHIQGMGEKRTTRGAGKTEEEEYEDNKVDNIRIVRELVRRG